jgi:hypothetical protein
VQDSTGAVPVPNSGSGTSYWCGPASIVHLSQTEYWKNEQIRAVATDVVTVRGDSKTRAIVPTMWILYTPFPESDPNCRIRMDIVQVNNIEERGFEIDLLVMRGGK